MRAGHGQQNIGIRDLAVLKRGGNRTLPYLATPGHDDRLKAAVGVLSGDALRLTSPKKSRVLGAIPHGDC